MNSITPTVLLLGTLDTKGQEVRFLRDLLKDAGCSTLIVDVGTLYPPQMEPDVSREMVAAEAGTTTEELVKAGDRPRAVETMIRGASRIVSQLHQTGKVSAILSVGGGTGTHIGMGVMRSLPIGVPKLMVSTVASRDMSNLIGTRDITVMHSVVDILGLNALSRRILTNAAGAIAGMARVAGHIKSDRPIIGLTSFGFITEGAMRIKAMLEEKGYDVAPFHANGTGGMAMEDLIEEGVIAGVVDLALHEFADALYDGYCGGIGAGRLESAGRKGIPQIVVPGGLDCVVLEFNSLETMPASVQGRKVFWYDFRSGVRTTVDDLLTLASTIAAKLNRAKGPTRVLIPLRGWSEADMVGGPLYEPETNQVFVAHLRSALDARIVLREVDAHINDDEFAQAVVEELVSVMQG